MAMIPRAEKRCFAKLGVKICCLMNSRIERIINNYSKIARAISTLSVWTSSVLVSVRVMILIFSAQNSLAAASRIL